MKRFCTIFVAILLFGALATSSLAAGAKATLSSATAEKGESVSITLSLSNCDNFVNLGFEVGYDSDIFTLTKVTNNPSVDATYLPAQYYTKNPYNMSWEKYDGSNYNGTLATLTFSVAEDAPSGDYPITLSYYKGRDGNFQDGNHVNYDYYMNAIGLTYVSGKITVNGSGNGGGTGGSGGTIVPAPTPTPAPKPAISARNVSTSNNIAVDVDLTAIVNGGKLIGALYTSGGKLVQFKSYPASSDVTVTFDKGVTGKYVKIMWWESYNALKPVCESKTVTIN